MKLYIRNITFGYKNGFRIENLSSEIEGFTVLLGPNGSGKTTLLRIILGILKPEKGEIIYNGKDIISLKPLQRARLISFIPQFYSEIRGFTVYDMVMMGRYPYKKGFLLREDRKDKDKVKKMIERVSLKDFEKRNFSELSGGERQKVIIARALAQDSEILLLDEPTAHLDLKNQVEILEILKELKREKIIFGVFHEPFLSLKYADRMILMDKGKIIYEGKPDYRIVLNLYNLDKLL